MAPKLADVRRALKAIAPDTRVVRYSDGSFGITIHHELDRTIAALPSLGLTADKPRVADGIGSRWDWWYSVTAHVR